MTSQPAGYADRVRALLGYVMESQLNAVPLDSARIRGLRVASPWDIWWISYRTGRSSRLLGIHSISQDHRCPRCRSDAAFLAGQDQPGHPDELSPRTCDCLTAWAMQMRTPHPTRSWPPLSTCVALIKPGADAAAVRELLTQDFQVLDTQTLQLEQRDVRRLYPDAYGGAYVAAQDTYMTSTPVHAHLLKTTPARVTTTPVLSTPEARSSTTVSLSRPTQISSPREVKARIRRTLGDGDVRRNHLHMPDNPGDTFVDIAHLFGWDRLRELYERNDRDTASARLAGYWAVLEGT